jgi:hypothetical protein
MDLLASQVLGTASRAALLPGKGACADLCLQATTAWEAIQLTALGARAGLVVQLTGISKAAANRLYRTLHGCPSPPGQLPFTDTWYVRRAGRVAQASIVWGLFHQRFLDGLSPARRLIEVTECYRWILREPLLDLTRVAYVPHLVATHEWEPLICSVCGSEYLSPPGTLGTLCRGCRRYWQRGPRR